MGNRTILLSAENGPILAADETGLVLRLSDRVVADLARRLAALPGAQPHAEPNSVTAQAAAAIPLDPAILGDIDGWDVTRQGDWLSFTARLPGADGPRRYLRHISGTGVLAQTPGPVRGIFSIAGGRRFNAPSLSPDFPFHILGTAAFEDADEDPPLFDNLRHCGLDADLAAALLRRRHADFRALPLFACAACPREGDLAPFRAALDRFAALGAALHKAPRVAAICLEVSADQVAPDQNADAFHHALLSQLDTIAQAVAEAGLPPARMLMTLDCGGWWGSDPTRARIAAEGLCRLALCPGTHDLTLTGSTASLTQDRLGQPLRASALIQAELESRALEALAGRENWTAPILCLVERDGPRGLRALFKSAAPLVIDTGDPMGAGPLAGFALSGAPEGIEISEIGIDPQDPRAIRLTLNADLPREVAARLEYAMPRAPDPDSRLPGWAGALRDDWQGETGTGAPVYRWALPASQVIR
ncbi:hypothetical protein [Paracoccus xiamenensis]|uniref:hypothetical protein n=1 Tax=Paracoccus xiamenensis TaxID=2714901 RepID=UPI00140D577D|nr:hypothetical protein [Paracoccus xiamenensis]NHF73017.1 hypothetical protein [Paracoccus xiamenensis]